jgi:predicted metalloprotease
MRWRGGRRSGNIEDRRGFGGGFRSPFGGGGGMRFPGGFPIPTGRGGLGGIGMIIVILVVLYFAFEQGGLVDTGPDQSGLTTTDEAGYSETPGEDELRDFVAVVLGDTEDTWSALFREMNRNYDYPTLVLFTGAVDSACGYAQSAVGPFYCPGDQKIYLDLGFFAELSRRFQAPGDFAAAYVIAHEVGHHVQTLFGITDKVDSLRARSNEVQANALSVRVELQADCFAGVWAYHAHAARQVLETGDLEEALTAASAIGDDRLQRENQGYVVPDSFTHGTSEQRARWFRRGFAEGALGNCDTFNAGDL